MLAWSHPGNLYNLPGVYLWHDIPAGPTCLPSPRESLPLVPLYVFLENSSHTVVIIDLPGARFLPLSLGPLLC